jgi:hypothetical protein
MKKIIFGILFLGGFFLLSPRTIYAQEVLSKSISVDKKDLKDQTKIEKSKIKLEKNREKIVKMKEKY